MLTSRFSDESTQKIIFIAVFLLLVLVALHRLYDFAGVRYLTSDDIEVSVGWFFELKSNNDALALARQLALTEGRFVHLLTAPIWIWVSGIENQLVYDVLNLGSFLVAIALLAVVVGQLLSVWVSALFITAFLVFSRNCGTTLLLLLLQYSPGFL